MQGSQLRHQDDGLLATAAEEVTLDRCKEVDQAPGGRPTAVSSLGVQGQGFQPFTLHRPAEFSLQERLGKQGEEVQAEESLDAADVLEAYGRRFSRGR